jgi:hypothetical protein
MLAKYMLENFIESLTPIYNLPHIRVKPEDFIKIVEMKSDVIIFREWIDPKVKRFSLTGFAGDNEPDIFIIYQGVIIHTDANRSLTTLNEFKQRVLEDNSEKL